jgi:MFS transporter, PPP family, 3-phenylpropionic acid transporter
VLSRAPASRENGPNGAATSRLAKTRFALSYFSLFAVYGVATPYLQILLRDLGYGPAFVGFLLGLFEVVGVFGPLAISRFVDSSGTYRPSLLACAALIVAPLAPLILVPGPVSVILCLVSLSLGIRGMAPIMDAATTAVISSARGWDYGLLRAAGSAGFIAIAVALQLIPGFDSSPPGNIALWIGGTGMAFGLSVLILPESGRGRIGKNNRKRVPGNRVEGDRASILLDARSAERTRTSAIQSSVPLEVAIPLEVPTAISRSPKTSAPPRAMAGAFALGLLIIGLGRLVTAPVNSFFSLYLVERVKWNAVGAMWALGAIAEIPLLLLSGRIVARLGAMGSIALGSAAIALRLALYSLFPHPVSVVAAQLLNSLCFGLVHPASVAFVTRMVSPERRALGMAAYAGLGIGLPSFAGSALGGIIVQGWGYRALFGSFIVFAIVALAIYAAKREVFAVSEARGAGTAVADSEIARSKEF